MAVLTPASVFAPGRNPPKSEVIQLFEQITGTASAPAVTKDTLAELNLVTPASENYGGLVLNDPDPTKNGYYFRDAGAWVWGRGFPDTVASVALSGAANSQIGTPGAGVNPGSVLIFFAIVTTANTGPMTLAVGGETPRAVVNAAGNPLSAGEWTGAVVFFINGDGDYQLLFDANAVAVSSANVTLTAGHAAAAEAAKIAAQAAASSVSPTEFPNIATAQALSPPSPPDFIRTAGYTTAGDGGGALYKKVVSEPAHAGKFSITLDDTVTVVWYEIAELIIRPEMLGVPLTGVSAREGLQQCLDTAVGKVLAISKNYSVPLIPVESAGDGLPAVALKVPGNSHVVFENGAKVELQEHWQWNYRILSLDTVGNITLVNPYVDGRRDLNTTLNPVDDGRDGNGQGIHLAGTTGRVHIYSPRTDNCTGEGLCISYSFAGGGSNRRHCDWVYVQNHRADNNRRQGAAIISAIWCVFDNPEWTNTNGCLPGAGLDIEPDNSGGGDTRLDYIRINNPKTSGNAGAGILMYLNSIAADPGASSIDIEINGHQSDGDLIGVWIDRVENGVIGGKITIDKPLSLNAKESAFAVTSVRKDGPCITFNEPRAIDPNRNGLVFEGFAAVFRVTRPAGDTAVQPMGNVHFINPSVKVNSGAVPRLAVFGDYSVAATAVENISFIDPLDIDLGASSAEAHTLGFFGTGKTSDRHRQAVLEVTSSADLGAYALPIVVRATIAVQQNIRLPSGLSFGSPDITVELGSNGQELRVLPPVGGNFLGYAVDQYYASSGLGATLVIRPLGDNRFVVLNNPAGWTVA